MRKRCSWTLRKICELGCDDICLLLHGGGPLGKHTFFLSVSLNLVHRRGSQFSALVGKAEFPR